MHILICGMKYFKDSKTDLVSIFSHANTLIFIKLGMLISELLISRRS